VVAVTRGALSWLTIAAAAGVLACAEWGGGPALGGTRLSIVPVFSTSPGGSGGAATVLLDDLDRLRVIVSPSAPGLTAGAVVDTTVPVDAAGNATLSVRVVVTGALQTYVVQLEGIRSRDSSVLYSGSSVVTVQPGLPTVVASVPVSYIGPCALGAGCVVAVGPQGSAPLQKGASLAMTAVVDSPSGTPAPNVPVRLVNVTPALIDLSSGLSVKALSGTSCGPARVAADIPGSSDTLRLTVSAPVTVPALLFAGDSFPDTLGASGGVFCQNPAGAGRFHVSLNGRSGDVNPRYSPDRQRVAFTYRPVSAPNVLVVARWAGDSEFVAVSDTSAYRPRWSPNGAHLAFACGDGVSTDQDVCVFQDATVPLVAFITAPRIFLTDSVTSRPDGPSAFAWDPLIPDRIALVRDSLVGQWWSSALYVAGFDGTGIVQLTLQPLDVGTGVLQIRDLDWSPRGDVIVFSAADTLLDTKLFAINRDGTKLRRLTKGPGSDSRPVISPDGTQVVFLRDQSCSLDYWRIGLDGSGEQQVTSERFCDITTASLGHDWSPDGAEIVLVGAGPNGPFSGFMAYRVLAGTTAATYAADRIPVRPIDPLTSSNDIQPSWRP
jgi:hypothetical protein